MIYRRQRQYIYLGILAAILLLIGIGVLSYRTIYKSRQQARSVLQSHKITETAKSFLANINGAETGNRGFIITNDSAYLETYSGAAARNDSILQELQNITSGSLVQQNNVKELYSLSTARFGRLTLVQSTAKNKGFEAAKALINQGKGKRLMDNIRQVTDNIIAEENRLLDIREQEAERTAKATYFTIIAGTLVSIFFILVAFIMLLQQLKRTQKSENKMRELKEAEEVLSEHLVQQNTQMQEFAYIISHNLKKPVNNLIGLLNLYKDNSGSYDKEKVFGKIDQEIYYLSDTLKRMLEVLRIKQNPNKKREKLAFEDVLNKVKDILNSQIVEKKAEIKADFSNANTISYPRTYLENIMLHLLSNALKFSQPDRIPKIYINTEQKDGQTLLRVTDNGLGIDLEKHGHSIFHLNRTISRNQQDKGISLFIIKNQLEALGGEIKVTSELGKGTTFTVLFGKSKT